MSKRELKDLKILIVEDEPELRKILSLLLVRKGLQVTTASNGNEGFAQIESQPFDVVISDVKMPYCDGIQLLSKIRQRDSRVPYVYLATGFADINEQEAIALGARGLVHKPFNIQMIVEQIEKCLVDFNSTAA